MGTERTYLCHHTIATHNTQLATPLGQPLGYDYATATCWRYAQGAVCASLALTAIGSSNQNVEPAPGVLSTPVLPWWCSTIVRVI
jgi:hypothetical protein